MTGAVLDLAFVSTNPGKFREVRAILRPYGVRVRWVRQELPEIQADDLEEVARHKARAVRRVRGPVIVEDSGLFVRSLAGFPGVYSAHFLRIWGFAPILELLRSRRREASFRSVVVLRKGGTLRAFEGDVRGTIAARAAGTGGFGYDPIFVPRGYRTTFAELPAATKNALSHRGRAMRKLGRFLAGPVSANPPLPRSRSRPRVRR